MKRMSLFILVVSAAICVLGGCDKIRDSRPHPELGVLDLSTYDLRNEGIVSLSGEWEFFWQRTHDEALKNGYTGGFRAKLPKPWSAYRIGPKNLPPYGFATYRLIVDRGSNSGNLALKFREVEDSYRIYVNGKQLGEVGFFAKEYRFARWAFRPAVYVIDDPASRLDIVVEVSNFVYTGGGLTTEISLGTESQIEAMSSIRQGVEFFVFGALLIFGIYHLFLFLMRRDDPSARSALFFGLFTILLSLRTLLLGERFLPGLFPDSVFEYFFAVDFVTIILPSVLFLLYMYEMFPGIAGKRFRIVSVIPGLLLSVLVVVMPTRLYVHFLPIMNGVVVGSCVVGLVIAVIALFRKHDNAFIFIAGFIFMTGTVINDILYSMYYVNTSHIASFGILIFILCQGLIISLRYAKLYRENRDLNQRLESSNRILETTVSERTSDLRTMNDELTEKNAFLNKLTDRLERMAFFDELTKVANKRYFNYCFDSEWKRAARRSEVFSLIMIDIDGFKKYNDTYGHIAGDECLAAVASAISGTLKRPGDFVARFGGEEFAVLLPGTGKDGALAVAEKMRLAVYNCAIIHERMDTGRVTISCGVVTGTNKSFRSADDMLSGSDSALYAAKEKGRNRVESSGLSRE